MMKLGMALRQQEVTAVTRDHRCNRLLPCSSYTSAVDGENDVAGMVPHAGRSTVSYYLY